MQFPVLIKVELDLENFEKVRILLRKTIQILLFTKMKTMHSLEK